MTSDLWEGEVRKWIRVAGDWCLGLIGRALLVRGATFRDISRGLFWSDL